MRLKRIMLFITALAALTLPSCSPQKAAGNNTLPLSQTGLQSSINTLASAHTAVPRSFPDVRILRGDEENIVSVTDCGAVGDGETDDTAAVAAAVEQAASVSGIVFFPDGKYLVGDAVIPENVGCAVNGVISVQKDKIFTIASSRVWFPKKQVFSGEGAIGTLSGIGYCYPEWFGAVAGDNKDCSDALQKAVNSAKTVYLSQGYYTVEMPVEIPQGADVTVTGAGQNSTFIMMNGLSKDFAVFTYEYLSGEPSVFSVEFCYINDDASRKRTLVRYSGTPEHRTGSVNMRGLLCNSVKNLAELSYVSGCVFEEIRSDDAANLFELTAADNITFSKVIASDNTLGMVRANGLDSAGNRSSGLKFILTSSVGAGNVDFDIRNYENVVFDHSSGDLGYGSEVLSALYMENVNDFHILRCWFASNAGLSVIESSDYAGLKAGIRLVNCSDGDVTNSSIVNQRDGIVVNGFREGADQSERILLLGNTFLGNGRCEIRLEDVSHLTVEGNFFISTNDYDQLNPDYRNPGHSFCMMSFGTCTDTVIRYNSGKVYRDDDAFLENKAEGAVYHGNMYK